MDLAQPLGSSGYEVIGAPDDRLGASAAGIGDLDRDGRSDIALGGRRAWVLYGKADTAPVNLASQSAGIRVDMPADGGSRAVVEGSGDLNEDGTPDLIVGQRPGVRSRAYGIYLPRGRWRAQPTTTVNVETMGGHEGATFVGPGNALAGEAVDGLDSAIDGRGAALIGAPAAAASSGTRAEAGVVYLVTNDALAATGAPGTGAGLAALAEPAASTLACPPFKKGIWRDRKRSYTPCFQIGKNHYREPYLPFEERTSDRSLMRLPTSRRTQRDAVDDGPVPRNIGKGGRSGSETDQGQGPVQDLGGELAKKWPIYDSFRNPIAYIAQISRNANRDKFAVYQPDGQTLVDTTRGKREGILVNQDTNGPAFVEIQGKGCMVTENLSRQHVLIGLVSGNDTRPTESDIRYRQNVGVGNKYLGVRGFIDRAAIPAGVLGDNDAVFDRRDTGCGATRRTPGVEPVWVPPQPFERTVHVYHGITSYRACQTYSADVRKQAAERSDCATAYAAYSAPEALTPGNVALLTVSTTGITGRGGAVRALVRTGTPWTPIDKMGYRDRNVGCGAPESARWQFYDANPKADEINQANDDARAAQGQPPVPVNDRQRHIYGWWPILSQGDAVRFDVRDTEKDEARVCDPE